MGDRPRSEQEARALYEHADACELRRLVSDWPTEALKRYVGPYAFAELERRICGVSHG